MVVRGDGSCYIYAILASLGLLDHGHTHRELTPSPEDLRKEALLRRKIWIWTKDINRDKFRQDQGLPEAENILLSESPVYHGIHLHTLGLFGRYADITALAAILNIDIVCTNEKVKVETQPTICTRQGNTQICNNLAHTAKEIHLGRYIVIEWNGEFETGHYAAYAQAGGPRNYTPPNWLIQQDPSPTGPAPNHSGLSKAPVQDTQDTYVISDSEPEDMDPMPPPSYLISPTGENTHGASASNSQQEPKPIVGLWPPQQEIHSIPNIREGQTRRESKRHSTQVSTQASKCKDKDAKWAAIGRAADTTAAELRKAKKDAALEGRRALIPSAAGKMARIKELASHFNLTSLLRANLKVARVEHLQTISNWRRVPEGKGDQLIIFRHEDGSEEIRAAILKAEWGRGLFLASQGKDDQALGFYEGDTVEGGDEGWRKLAINNGRHDTLEFSANKCINGFNGKPGMQFANNVSSASATTTYKNTTGTVRLQCPTAELARGTEDSHTFLRLEAWCLERSRRAHQLQGSGHAVLGTREQ